MSRPSRRSASRSVCPACGSDDRIPIVYGLPTDYAIERANRGEVALGGCLIEDRNPHWECRACGKQWNDSAGEARQVRLGR